MWRRALGVSVSLLALCGCSTVPLPQPFPLNSVTSFSAQGKGNLLNVGSVSDEQGLQLKPGDVIYLRRWSPGTGDLLQASRINRTSPPAFDSRNPLRHVKDGPDARLYDYEREFLINVLSVNRNDQLKLIDTQTKKDLVDALRSNKNEIALWKALVDNLYVKRLADDLVLTIRLSKVLAVLSEKHRGLFITGQGDREVAGIETPAASPYETMVQSTQVNGNYYRDDSALFSFVTVELGGVTMTHPGKQESQWTLQDWEDAEICQAETLWGEAPASIRTIWLKGRLGEIHVVPDRSTYELKLDLANRSRFLEHRPGASWLYPSIARKDLKLLTLRDLRDLQWSFVGAESNHVAPNCRLH